MKTAKISAFALAFVFSVVTVGAPAASAANETTIVPDDRKVQTDNGRFGPSETTSFGGPTKKEKLITNCKNRVSVNSNFGTLMSQYAEHYYIASTNANVYPTKKVKQLDGSDINIQAAAGKVTVKSGGKDKQITRVNYANFTARHIAARNASATQAGMKEKAVYANYGKQIADTNSAVSAAKTKIDSKKIEWQANVSKGVDCNTVGGRAEAIKQTKQRSAILKEMRADLADVKANAKKTSAEYKKVAVEYKKTKKAKR